MSGGAPVRWDGGAYSAANAHHRAFDDEFLAPLGLSRGQRVVDVGCGTGELTERIAGVAVPDDAVPDRAVPDDAVPDRAVPDAGEVVGVEPDGSLFAVAARRSRPGLCFVPARAQGLVDAVGAEHFDAVVSVAVLHWIPAEDHPGVLAQLAAVLRPEGLLRLDFGGRGQIERPRDVIEEVAREHEMPGAPWHFPTAQEYAALLQEAGFSLDRGWARLVRQRRSFPDPQGLRGWLRSQILPAYTRGVDEQAASRFAAAAEARCLQRLRRSDGSYDQEYVRLDVFARRG